MGSSCRDLVLITCLLIGLLVWKADARFADFMHLKLSDKNSSVVAPAKPPAAGSEVKAPATAPAAAAAAAGPGTGSEGSSVFDVTKHGAVGDGKTDNNKAFTAAWTAACKFAGASTFLVPKGDFLVTPIVFSGPCDNKSPLVEIRGKILAPATIDSSSNSVAWILFQKLAHLNISGVGTGTLDGQGQTAWAQNGCRHTSNSNCKMLQTSLQLATINGGSLSDITLLNSKAFHSVIVQTNDFTVRNAKIIAPGFSPNTDGVHIGDSTGITVTDSEIGTGDDCVSIGSGTSNIMVSNVQCGPGHGISVGSLGKYPNEKEVKGLRVKNCTFISSDNGVRIKTWPASPANTVSDIIFEDITMTNVSNPIIINQQYCDKQQCDATPSQVKLTDIHFKNIKGTSFTKTAVSLTCSKSVPCETVELVDINLKYTNADGVATSVCTNVKGIASGVQFPTSCL